MTTFDCHFSTIIHLKKRCVCILNKKVKWLSIDNYGGCLTPVGHEDFQSSILQEVASGKDGTNLREQPFSMKTFCVG